MRIFGWASPSEVDELMQKLALLIQEVNSCRKSYQGLKSRHQKLLDRQWPIYLEVHRGKRGRWRWNARDTSGEGKPRLVAQCPVKGFRTKKEAIADAYKLFGAPRVTLNK